MNEANYGIAEESISQKNDEQEVTSIHLPPTKHTYKIEICFLLKVNEANHGGAEESISQNEKRKGGNNIRLPPTKHTNLKFIFLSRLKKPIHAVLQRKAFPRKVKKR